MVQLTESQLREFDEKGWLLLPNAVPPSLLQPLLDAAARVARGARTPEGWPHGGFRLHSAGVRERLLQPLSLILATCGRIASVKGPTQSWCSGGGAICHARK